MCCLLGRPLRKLRAPNEAESPSEELFVNKLYFAEGSIDHLHGRIMSSRQRIYDPVSDTSPLPANKPIVASGMGTEALGQITPWCT